MTKEIFLKFERMTEDDIPALTAIMTRAFDDETQRFLGEPKGGPPGYDTGEFLQKWAFDEGGQGWKIIADNETVGAFILFTNPEKDYWLGTIFIDPTHQNKKIGTRAWYFIEETYADAKTWNLDTPVWATRNHHFYEKLGFSQVNVWEDQITYVKQKTP